MGWDLDRQLPVNTKAQKLASAAASEANSIASKVASLRSQAKTLATQARAQVTEALKFTAEVDDITFDSPTFQEPQQATAPEATPPSISAVGNIDALQFDAELPSFEFTQGTMAAPTIPNLRFSAPPSVGSSLSAPQAPETTTFTVPEAPALSFRVRTLPEITAPKISAPTPLKNTITAPQGLQVGDVSRGDLDAALDRLQQQPTELTLPEYESTLLEPVFDVVDAVLLGQRKLVDTSSLLDRTDTTFLAQDAWTLRGFDAPTQSALDQVALRLQDYFAADTARALTAMDVQWLHESLREALSAGAQAHGLGVDILLGSYDNQFAVLTAMAEALLQLANASVAAYNGAAAQYNAAAQAYSARLAALESEVAQYRIQAEVAELQGRTASMQADTFASQERAKSTVARTYAAQLGAEEAKVRAYRTKMQALGARVQAQGIAVEEYRGRLMEWTADLENSRAEYARYAASARAVTTQNSALAGQARLEAAKAEASAAQTATTAALIGVDAAKFNAAAALREARYSQIELTNTLESVRMEAEQVVYGAQAQAARVVNANNAATMEAAGSVAATKARFSEQLLNSAGRAAQLTQGVNFQLASAYAQIYTAAGRASAAIASGEFAGIRAAARISADGDMSGTTNGTTSINWSYSNDSAVINRRTRDGD